MFCLERNDIIIIYNSSRNELLLFSGWCVYLRWTVTRQRNEKSIIVTGNDMVVLSVVSFCLKELF